MSSIDFFCSRCGETLSATEESAGQRAECPGCGSPVEVPPKPSGESINAIEFRCTGCGETLEAPADATGQETSCPACGASLRVPRRSRLTLRQQPQPFSPAPSEMPVMGVGGEPVHGQSADAAGGDTDMDVFNIGRQQMTLLHAFGLVLATLVMLLLADPILDSYVQGIVPRLFGVQFIFVSAMRVVAIASLVVCVYQLAKAEKFRLPLLWMPVLLNIVGVLVLVIKASRILRSHQIPVGILGPDIPHLRLLMLRKTSVAGSAARAAIERLERAQRFAGIAAKLIGTAALGLTLCAVDIRRAEKKIMGEFQAAIAIAEKDGATESAINAIRGFIERNPRSPQAAYGRDTVLPELLRMQEECRTALDADVDAARSLASAGQFDSALELLTASVATNVWAPNIAEAQAACAQINREKTDEERRQRSLAREEKLRRQQLEEDIAAATWRMQESAAEAEQQRRAATADRVSNYIRSTYPRFGGAYRSPQEASDETDRRNQLLSGHKDALTESVLQRGGGMIAGPRAYPWQYCYDKRLNLFVVYQP